MKIIIIKNYKVGKTNEIVEVSDGYAKNFLIPKGIALPYNNKTIVYLNKNITLEKEKEKKIIINLNKIKNLIEKLNLTFFVKSNNGIIHNSISKKMIIQELKKNKIEIKSQFIENIKINSLGLISVKINLEKNVVAVLKLEVKNAN